MGNREPIRGLVFGDFSHTWRTLVATDLVYKAAAFVILVPLSRLLANQLEGHYRRLNHGRCYKFVYQLCHYRHKQYIMQVLVFGLYVFFLGKLLPELTQ